MGIITEQFFIRNSHRLNRGQNRPETFDYRFSLTSTNRRNSIPIRSKLPLLHHYFDNRRHRICLSIRLFPSFSLRFSERTKTGKRDEKATGSIGSFFQAGHVLGALASSFIVSQITQSRIILAILLTIVSVGISLLISLFLKEPKTDYKHVEKNPLEIISQSFALIKRNSSLKRIILLGIFTTPFAGYLRNFHPPYFQLANVAPYWLGLSLGIGGIAAALASKYAYKLEEVFGIEKGMFLATCLPGFLYVFMALVIHPVFAVVLFISNFGYMSFQDPLFADYYNVHIKSEIRATVLSTINMFSSAYIALMGLIIGWIAGFSVLYAFLFMGVIVLLAQLFSG